MSWFPPIATPSDIRFGRPISRRSGAVIDRPRTSVRRRVTTVAPLPYTWDEIEREWLTGGALALPPDLVLNAFDRVEAAFGREWIEATRRTDSGVATGSHTTLLVAHLGVRLELLAGVPGADELREKLRRRQPDGVAELDALYLIGSGAQIETELEPAFVFRGRVRKADLRVRESEGDLWAYVEVAQPNRSASWHVIESVVQEVIGLVEECEGQFTLEVLLHRDPSALELGELKNLILSRHVDGPQGQQELKNSLGALYWNDSIPGQIVLQDRGEEYTARVSGAGVRGEHGEPRRHIVCRCAFSDDRALRFLRNEAAQLPSDAPGVIMLQTSGAPGAMKRWGPIIEEQLFQERYRWVGAVCLFSSGLVGSDAGEHVQYETTLLKHPAPIHAVPEWAISQLARFRSGD